MFYLMKVYVVIEGNNSSDLCLGPNPSYCVSANRKKNQGHIEFESLCSTFCSCHTITHNVEYSSITVLDKLPNEEGNAD
jgi:hypothetical protein